VIVAEWFRSHSPVRQLLLIAAGVCLLSVILGAIWFFLLRVTYEPLFSNLRTADAATIVADLDKKKIPYRLEAGGTRILVPQDRADATRLNVMTEDLPLKGTAGFELFDKSDMGLTDFAQRINYQRALQGELERTIMTLDGVESVRVHISMGEDRIFRDDSVPPKASVAIRMRNGTALPVSAAQGIRRLIATAVPKLDVVNVVVVDERGEVVGSRPVNSTTVSKEVVDPDAQEREAIEQYYASSVRRALENSDFDGDLDVTVRADLGSAANADKREALEGWAPEVRKFPLRVTISSPIPLDSALQGNLRDVALKAIGSTSAYADSISFIIMPASALPNVGATLRERAMSIVRTKFRPQVVDGGPNLVEEVLVGVVPVVVLLGIFFLLLRARKPRKLDERQRNEFVSRLRTALEKGEAHASRS
jgi:flagellar M-ring protein FliF